MCMFPKGTDEMDGCCVVYEKSRYRGHLRTTFLTWVSERANLQADTFDLESSLCCLFVLSDSRGSMVAIPSVVEFRATPPVNEADLPESF